MGCGGRVNKNRVIIYLWNTYVFILVQNILLVK